MNDYTLSVMYKRAEFYRKLINPDNTLMVNLEYNQLRHAWWVYAEFEQIARRYKKKWGG